MTPKVQGKKTKRQFGLQQNVKLLCIKGRYQQSKMQITEREKIFAKHTSGKRLRPQIYKELLKFNNNKIAYLKNGQRFK